MPATKTLLQLLERLESDLQFTHDALAGLIVTAKRVAAAKRRVARKPPNYTWVTRLLYLRLAQIHCVIHEMSGLADDLDSVVAALYDDDVTAEIASLPEPPDRPVVVIPFPGRGCPPEGAPS